MNTQYNITTTINEAFNLLIVELDTNIDYMDLISDKENLSLYCECFLSDWEINNVNAKALAHHVDGWLNN